MGEREPDSENDWGDWISAGNQRDRSRSEARGWQSGRDWWSQGSLGSRDWWSQGSDSGSAARPAATAAPSGLASRAAPAAPSGSCDSTVPVDERPRRHARAGHSNRPSRQERNALYWFWSAIKANRSSFMGISEFRRMVERWLNTVLFSAEQDAESDSASRRPIDADPAGAIDGRVVDAVEEALAEAGSGSRAIRTTFDIQHQAPLSESELSAMYGIGHRLLRSRIDGPQPLAHVRRPRAHQQAGTSDHASAGRPGIVGVASGAEEVIDIVTESPTCRICLYPENAEDGPLRAYGVACSHMFHLHCITQWSSTNRNDCPVCRQPFSLADNSTTPATPATSPQSDMIDVALIATSAAFSEDSLRNSGLDEHTLFIEQLGLVDRLPTPAYGPGSQLLGEAQAQSFTDLWFRNRSFNPDEYFMATRTHLCHDENSMPHYWLECRLAENSRMRLAGNTASCQTAFHGSNMSCLYSIMKRGFLDTGPRAKRSNNHGHRRQFGVYCHKHGTRRKAANYMKYFQYQGFIAAPLLELKVRNYIACGDQWCCDPSDVQIESVWIHIVPIRSVGLNRYFIVASPWQNSYELQPIFEPARSRYSLD